MKTAISIPEDIFATSKEIAKELNLSRSAVFALGVRKLREGMDRQAMIARINKVCDEVDTSLDPVIKEYTYRKMREVEW